MHRVDFAMNKLTGILVDLDGGSVALQLDDLSDKLVVSDTHLI